MKPLKRLFCWLEGIFFILSTGWMMGHLFDEDLVCEVCGYKLEEEE